MFLRLISGGNSSPTKSGMRRGQESPADKSLKSTSPGDSERTKTPHPLKDLLHASVRFKKPVMLPIHYLLGHRNDIVNDLDSELPIVELTLQANKNEDICLSPN